MRWRRLLGVAVVALGAVLAACNTSIQGGIRLEAWSLIPGRPPIGSICRDPYDGVEPVRAVVE